MCVTGASGVGGAKGGPQQNPTQVSQSGTKGGGGAGTASTDVAAKAGALGGPTGGAVAGASSLGSGSTTTNAAGKGAVAGAASVPAKGGPAPDMSTILQSLTDIVARLGEAIKSMGPKGSVAGAAGGSAPTPPKGGGGSVAGAASAPEAPKGGAAGGCGCSSKSGGGATQKTPVQGVKGMWGDGAPPAPAGGGAAPPAAPAPIAASVPTRTGGAEDAAYEQQVLDLVNAERAKAGLGAVRYSAALDSAAETHNAFQTQQRTMAHIDIGDGDPGARIRAAGFNGAWGENVAVGQRTPEQVVAEWMASPTHRANILNPNFSQIGVAHETTTDGFSFWTQSFGA